MAKKAEMTNGNRKHGSTGCDNRDGRKLAAGYERTGTRAQTHLCKCAAPQSEGTVRRVHFALSGCYRSA